MNKVAFGCSHTYGIGVEPYQAWPALLGAENFGQPGCSSDYVVRKLKEVLQTQLPDVVYILWPDWTRFEYNINETYYQSLPTDKDRIQWMETATEEWLKENFEKQRNYANDLCKNTKLIDMTLYDLIPYIDHADKWPLSKLGHHYNEEWHQWVADIFKNKAEWIIDHRLFA